MQGDSSPSDAMSDEEFRELFERIFGPGQKWIYSQGAKPVFFSSIDAAGRLGPTRNMEGGYKICKEIGQNKLISAYGIKDRSKFSKQGPTPFTAMTRPLLNVLTPPLMQILVPRACAKNSKDPVARNNPLAGWFLRFVNKYKLWYLGWQGAVPVYHKATGAFVAAFAASGATGDQDEGAVEMGLAAAGLKRVDGRWLWISRGEAAAKGGRLGVEEEEPEPGKGVAPLVGVRGPITGDRPGNLVDWGLVGEIGGPMSIMLTLRMDELRMWSRVFDFSPKPDFDSITVGNPELSPDLYFAIRRRGHGISVVVRGFFNLAQEVDALFTVSEDGHMKVWADGELVGEHPAGHTPLRVPRSHLTIAGHHAFPDQGFQGAIENVKFWDREVSWQVAASAEPKPAREMVGKGRG